MNIPGSLVGNSSRVDLLASLGRLPSLSRSHTCSPWHLFLFFRKKKKTYLMLLDASTHRSGRCQREREPARLNFLTDSILFFLSGSCILCFWFILCPLHLRFRCLTTLSAHGFNSHRPTSFLLPSPFHMLGLELEKEKEKKKIFFVCGVPTFKAHPLFLPGVPAGWDCGQPLPAGGRK